MSRISAKNPLFILIYLASFLYSFHYALPIYIESSFIKGFLSTEKTIGLIFSIAAVFTAGFTFFFPRILRRFGNYRATLTAMGLEIIALLILAFFTNPAVIISAFILHQTLAAIIFLNFDNFVEAFSVDSATGGIRGLFMTVLNTAFVVAPFLAGLMLSDHDFWKIYLAGAILMAMSFIVIAKNFKNYIDPAYVVPLFKETLSVIKESHDIHSIIYAHFLLAFFYSWMVIYVPLYLNQHIGISMNEILGIITPIALLPFVLFEVILGKIADTKLGEKEILTLGFVIMALSAASLSFVTTASVAVWTALLFITRTGASMVEVTTESYFFKQVNAGDTHLITFMRTMRAVAGILGPLVGFVLLSYLDFNYLFLVLGIIMLTALPYSLTIKDTR
ncbi:MAG: MFS transporter [Candidatus Yonathbacteria bacterium]|nr:MFS transporter [Candidatus Yonathbacteria bacterium]